MQPKTLFAHQRAETVFSLIKLWCSFLSDMKKKRFKNWLVCPISSFVFRCNMIRHLINTAILLLFFKGNEIYSKLFILDQDLQCRATVTSVLLFINSIVSVNVSFSLQASQWTVLSHRPLLIYCLKPTQNQWVFTVLTPVQA